MRFLNLYTPRYKCRQRVRARYRRGPTYYAATVQAVRDNGTYDVVYEDGSQDECLEEIYLTPAMHGVSEAQTLAPGLLLSALSRVTSDTKPVKRSHHKMVTRYDDDDEYHDDDVSDDEEPHQTVSDVEERRRQSAVVVGAVALARSSGPRGHRGCFIASCVSSSSQKCRPAAAAASYRLSAVLSDERLSPRARNPGWSSTTRSSSSASATRLPRSARRAGPLPVPGRV